MFLPLIKCSVIKCLLNKWSSYITLLGVEVSYVVELANGGSFHTPVLQIGYRCAMILIPSTLRGIEQGLGRMDSSAPQPLLAAALPAAFSVYPSWLYR